MDNKDFHTRIIAKEHDSEFNSSIHFHNGSDKLILLSINIIHFHNFLIY